LTLQVRPPGHKGSYTIQVQGASGSVTNTFSLQLTVQ
jgi:hypothetical protein